MYLECLFLVFVTRCTSVTHCSEVVRQHCIYCIVFLHVCLCEAKCVVCFAVTYCSVVCLPLSVCVRVCVCVMIDVFLQLSPSTQARRKKGSGFCQSFSFIGIADYKLVGKRILSGLALQGLLDLENLPILNTLDSFWLARNIRSQSWWVVQKLLISSSDCTLHSHTALNQTCLQYWYDESQVCWTSHKTALVQYCGNVI